MSEHQTTRHKSARRGRIAATVSCVAAALVAVGVTVQPATAEGAAPTPVTARPSRRPRRPRLRSPRPAWVRRT
ncbi:hypothetical protein ACFQZC_20415 [Streptacidiphilus monticola]